MVSKSDRCRSADANFRRRARFPNGIGLGCASRFAVGTHQQISQRRLVRTQAVTASDEKRMIVDCGGVLVPCPKNGATAVLCKAARLPVMITHPGALRTRRGTRPRGLRGRRANDTVGYEVLHQTPRAIRL